MSPFDDAEQLLQHAAAELPKIRAAYDASLHAKEIKGALLVEVERLLPVRPRA